MESFIKEKQLFITKTVIRSLVKIQHDQTRLDFDQAIEQLENFLEQEFNGNNYRKVLELIFASGFYFQKKKTLADTITCFSEKLKNEKHKIVIFHMELVRKYGNHCSHGDSLNGTVSELEQQSVITSTIIILEKLIDYVIENNQKEVVTDSKSEKISENQNSNICEINQTSSPKSKKKKVVQTEKVETIKKLVLDETKVSLKKTQKTSTCQEKTTKIQCLKFDENSTTIIKEDAYYVDAVSNIIKNKSAKKGQLSNFFDKTLQQELIKNYGSLKNFLAKFPNHFEMTGDDIALGINQPKTNKESAPKIKKEKKKKTKKKSKK
eukprot:gene4863-8457_t